MSTMYISDQGAYLRKSAGRLTVTLHDEEICIIPEKLVDHVVIFGNVQISSKAVSDLLGQGIDIIYLSRSGKFKGIVEPGYPKNVFTRMAQYEASLDPQFSLEFARNIVFSKIESQQKVISYWHRNNWLDKLPQAFKTITSYKQELNSKSSLQAIRGVEAYTSKLYFSIWADALPPQFPWQGRSRRPPKDPINALMSLTYMMVLGELVSQSYAHALDPFIGYFHQLQYSAPALCLDLLEPLRALYCDQFVLTLVHNEEFLPTDFVTTPEHGFRLKAEPFKRYLAKYHQLCSEASRRKYSLRQSVSHLLSQTCQFIQNRTIEPFDMS